MSPDPSMDAAEYARTQAVFEAVLAAEPSARDEVLVDRCAGDDALRARVEELLQQADDASGAFSDRELAELRASLDRSLDARAGDELDEQPDGAIDAWLPERVGSYEVLGLVGRGGTGVVLEARQERPSRRVALKLVHPALSSRETARRLAREAEAFGRLQHPGIAQVFEAGSYEGALGVQPFLAMEYVDGLDLIRHAHAHGLRPRERTELLAEVAEAVAHAHERGVIHRDLKPDNVLVDGEGRPKLLDFGIARLLTEGGEGRFTLDSELLGTLAYMAPEQARAGSAVDASADVFALGALGVELLTGRRLRAVEGLTIATALREVAEGAIAIPSAAMRALPRDLGVVLSKALSESPMGRYSNAASFAADLRRFLDQRPVAARPPSALDRLAKYLRRHRALVAAAAAVALALTGGLLTATNAARDAQAAREETRRRLYAAEMALGASALMVPDGNRRVEAVARKWRELDPDGELRGWEWHLINSAERRDVTRLQVEGAPMAVDVHPDGRTVAIATGRGLALCSVDAVEPRSEVLDLLDSENGLWTTVAWDPDGAAVALGGVGGCAVWSVPEERIVWRSESDFVSALAWSEDGLRLFVVAQGGQQLLDGSTGEPLGPVDPDFVTAGHVPLDSDGRRLVRYAHERPLTVIDAWSGDTLVEFEEPVHVVNASAWSPDGARFATAGFDHCVRVWSVDPPRLELEIRDSQEPVIDVVWSADGKRLIAGGDDTTVRVYDAGSGERLEVFQAHRHQVRDVARIPGSNRIVSVSTEGDVFVWSEGAPAAFRRWSLGEVLPNEAFGDLSFTDDGALLASLEQGTAQLFEPDGRRSNAVLGSSAVRISPSGDFIAAMRADARLELSSAETGAVLDDVTIGDDPWTWLAWDPNGTRLACGGWSGLFLVEVDRDGRLRAHRIADLESQLTGLEWSADGLRIAVSTTNEAVWIHDAETGTRRVSAQPSPGVGAVSVAAGHGRVAVGGSDGTVRIVDAESGALTSELEGHAHWIEGVAWHPGGHRLASASRDRTVRIWNSETEDLVAAFDCGSRLCAVRWSPDGTRLVALDVEGRVHVWDAGRSTRESAGFAGDAPADYPRANAGRNPEATGRSARSDR